MKELYKLLRRCQLNFSRKSIEEIFKILDMDGSQNLTVDEFQKLSTNDLMKEKFRQVMRKVKEDTVYQSFNRAMNEQVDGNTSFVPLTFEALMDYLFRRESREQIN